MRGVPTRPPPRARVAGGGRDATVQLHAAHRRATVLLALPLAAVGADQKIEISKPRPYPDALQALLPFESPWTRELVTSCGAWTAYLNNSLPAAIRQR